jgi:hypothetical protein
MHKMLGSRRNGIAVCHRRLGKTVAARMELIHRALAQTKFEGAYVAPFLSQARRVFWGQLKEVASRIPYTEIRETEMLVVMPNKSTIRCLGADSGDGIRGLGFDYVVLDEFADFDPTVLPMVIIPTLAGRNGGMFIIGTPKGRDPLADMYEAKLNDHNWACFKYSAEDTGIISKDELATMRDSMTDQQYRLELCCDYSVGSTDQLISGTLVNEAVARTYTAEDVKHSARIMAADIARQGDDSTVITRRQGFQCWDQESWQSDDLMYTTKRIKEAYYGFKPDALFIDGGGIGAGVVDALRDQDVPVIEVQFGAKASDPRYLNLRAEMYLNLYHWLRRGGRIPDEVCLKRDLVGPRHFTNDKGQTQLESKEDMKKRGMKSPDHSDSLAMTFAMPVHPKSADKDLAPIWDWDPLKA